MIAETGGVRARALEDGRELWHTPYEQVEGVSIDGSKVLVGTSSDAEGAKVHVLDLATGSEDWSAGIPAVPVVVLAPAAAVASRVPGPPVAAPGCGAR